MSRLRAEWTTVNDRVRWIVNTRFGGNRSRLARAIGYSPAVIANAAKDKLPGPRLLAAIAECANVPIRWLKFGRGSPFVPLPASTSAPSRPDDLRAAGWMVAVHNDYRQEGSLMTFWLFTKDGRAAKGEGYTDREALDLVREEVRKLEAKPKHKR